MFEKLDPPRSPKMMRVLRRQQRIFHRKSPAIIGHFLVGGDDVSPCSSSRVGCLSGRTQRRDVVSCLMRLPFRKYSGFTLAPGLGNCLPHPVTSIRPAPVAGSEDLTRWPTG